MKTFDEAVKKCNERGTRLLHIRSEDMLSSIIKSRPLQFAQEDNFLRFFPGSVVALGLKYGILEGYSEETFYYSDNVKVDEFLQKSDTGALLGSDITFDNLWKDGYPIDGQECVGLNGAKLVSYPCNDTTYFTDKVELDESKPALGYLCETKSLNTIDEPKTSCTLPFKYQGKMYDSCSYEVIDGFNPDGSPWCATEVDEDGNAIPQKLKLCEDERRTILYGSGNGHMCPMPFLFDRVYYDHCTRKNNTLQSRYTTFYWCPDPRNVSENNVYSIPSGPIGACPEHLKPPENGCQESYTPLDENVCVRVSAFPETYEDAKAKCESEGAFLFQHTNAEASVSF